MRKLTESTKYDIIDNVAIIYAKKIGSTKFEPAFKCNPATIAFIKENGLKAALEKSLLVLP